MSGDGGDNDDVTELLLTPDHNRSYTKVNTTLKENHLVHHDNISSRPEKKLRVSQETAIRPKDTSETTQDDTSHSSSHDDSVSVVPLPDVSSKSHHPTHDEQSMSNLSVLFGCRRLDVYHCFVKLSEGTYGEVYKAQNKNTGDIVALKHIKYHAKMLDEGFPLTSLREISILLELNHPNIVNVKEVVVGRNPNHVYMVMEYSEHELRTLLERNRPSFSLSERKRLLYQLLSAVEYLHSHWILHRDLKTSNLLYSNEGALKICDFGMARKFGDPIQPYTHNVVTLWYRSPDLILGQKQYDAAVDMWSVGCIMGELLLRHPLFDGKNETDVLDKIFRLCGTPTEESWPEMKNLPALANSTGLEFKKYPPTWRQTFPVPKSHLTDPAALSDCGLHLLQSLLCLNPSKRITSKEALAHPFFSEKPLPQREHLMPTAPDSHVKARERRVTPSSSGSAEEQITLCHKSDYGYVFGRRVDPNRYLTKLESLTQHKNNHVDI